MEKLNYYYLLTTSYLTALLIWWVVQKTLKGIWDKTLAVKFQRPWLEVALVMLAAVATVLIGQLYSSKFLLPPFKLGVIRVSECFNQLLIFSPFVFYMIVRKQGLATGWLSREKAGARFLAGVMLGAVAIGVFVMLSRQRNYFTVLADVFHVRNVHYAVQIFIEDLAIALLLARLSDALGRKGFIYAVLVVAFLFSIGHLPAKLEDGVPLVQGLVDVLLDMALVALVALFLYRSKDILWFFPIHFAMDMMQFYSGVELN
ncbi:MAG: type II CAAX prenyl endopeptidase Rce1 family protein [Bacteroidota bacterium]